MLPFFITLSSLLVNYNITHFVFYFGQYYGDGSIISSVNDLLKWSKALSKNALLTNANFRKALQPTRSCKDSSLLLVWQ